MKKQTKLTENQEKVKQLIAPLVRIIMNEINVPKSGTYKLEMIVDTDGSVVIKSNDVGYMILANLIGLGNGNIKKYGDYYGQNVGSEFIFFTSNKSELSNR